MKPSNSRQQQPRRKREFDTEAADRMACELALDMLNWITTRYENADEDEKPGLIIQYGSVVIELQKVIAKVARAQQRRRRQRRYPGDIETKHA